MTDPTVADLRDPAFNVIWLAIRKWDIARNASDDLLALGPSAVTRTDHIHPSDLRAGATGTDVMSILQPLRDAGLLVGPDIVESIGKLDQKVEPADASALREQLNEARAGRLALQLGPIADNEPHVNMALAQVRYEGRPVEEVLVTTLRAVAERAQETEDRLVIEIMKTPPGFLMPGGR